MSREPFQEFSSYVGVPYVDHGRTPAGWDCYGLVYWLNHHALHRAVPSYLTDYGDAECVAEVQALIETTRHGWHSVAYADRVHGDTLVLTLAGAPIHCGLVIDSHLMLHCMRGRDTVIEDYGGPVWGRRVEGVYRWT